MKEFKSFFKDVGGNEGSKCHYTTRLDTYGCGCQHDCSYCYAKSLLSFRNLWDPEEPAVANIHKIENKIKKLPKGTILRLGGMTDCFQPCEIKNRVTYETIKLLNKYGIGYLIVTKSHLVANDEYDEILDKIVVLEGDEFADGAIGLTEDHRLVYSYDRLVKSLAKAYKQEDQDEGEAEISAIEWLDYNTIRSLPYMESQGLLAPVIIYEFD